MTKHTFKAELTLQRNKIDADGNLVVENKRYVTEDVPSVLLITIDVEGVARKLGHKAMKNKKRVAIEIGGYVEVEWRPKS